MGGGGGSSGGNYKMTGHKLPETGKPNSSMTRYDERGHKRETRYYDENGNKKKDTHFEGPPKHDYPHDHYWWQDDDGGWHVTPYGGPKPWALR